MRMWMVDPALMCRKHLLGEHVELHMFVGTIRKGVSLHGYVSKGLVDTARIQSRHEQLVAEMGRRGMRHRSQLPKFQAPAMGTVDASKSLSELESRCGDCAARIKEARSR